MIKKLYQIFRYNLCQRHIYGMTAHLRVLPDLILIGAGKSGTTSLFNYLNEHSCIVKPAYKEIGFFDDNFHLGLNWYRSLFPTKFTKHNIETKYGNFLTFEETPWYIYRPWVIKRIHDILPSVKILALLRNPVDKAYSHYNMDKTLKPARKTIKSFDEIIEDDIKNISKYEETHKKITDESFNDLVQNSYLARGFYAKQLKPWFKAFNRNDILVVSSEELFTKTQKTLDDIFSFLNLKSEKIMNIDKKNVGVYDNAMPQHIRKKLLAYFSKYNEDLFDLIDARFDWDK